MNTSWLIEWPATRQEPVRYWHPTEGHVIDPNHAVRFCRQEDAEAMLKRDGLHAGAKAVEHRWLHPSPEMGEISREELKTILDDKIFLRSLSPSEVEPGYTEGYGVFGLDNATDAILSKLKENGLSREGLGGDQPAPVVRGQGPNPVLTDGPLSDGVADVYPGWRGVTQPCDVCGKPVAVNAVSPSECHCSSECAQQAYGLSDGGRG